MGVSQRRSYGRAGGKGSARVEPRSRSAAAAEGARAHAKPGPGQCSRGESEARLSRPVLVLNRLYQPVNVTTARRALCMLYIGAARALDEQYQTFDFHGWMAAPTAETDAVRAVDRAIRIPKILVLEAYDKLPRIRIRFSRHNVFLRDDHTCQYCRRRLPRRSLNIDHVLPRSQGGKTHWENIVTSCLRCNAKKGGRTPEQAGMRLLVPPRKPRWADVAQPRRVEARYEEWRPFLLST